MQKKAFGENAHHMIENILYGRMPLYLKTYIFQAYRENGSYEQIVNHLQREREMKLNGLVADEPLFQTQLVVTKKDQNVEKYKKKQNEKSKTQTPRTEPNKTLKNEKSRCCKDACHTMTDWPKLAKKQNLD